MKIFNHLILLATTIFLVPFCNCAQNILANSDFSDINVCTEHDARCAPEAWLLASPNIPLFKNDEVGIVVLNTGKANVRQYLQTEMLMELEEGEEYQFSIRLRADDCIISSIGVKFSNEFVCFEKDQLIKGSDIDFSPEFRKIRKRKQRKWMDLRFSYKAKGGERFILIGSFESDKEQNRDFKNDPLPFKNYYYFIDQIELVPEYLDSLPSKSKEVENHLYSFNYRHSMCSYSPYQKPKEILPDSLKDKLEKPKTEAIVLGEVLFDFNSSSLKPEATDEIVKKMRTIALDSISKVNIYGYTDNVGEDEYNIKLSTTRAETVEKLLIEMGIDFKIIYSKGLGSSNPIANNNTKEGRSKNRRIEIVFEYR